MRYIHLHLMVLFNELLSVSMENIESNTHMTGFPENLKSPLESPMSGLDIFKKIF